MGPLATVIVALAVVLTAAACGGGESGGAGGKVRVDRNAERGRLEARPARGEARAERPGLHRLTASGGVEGLLHVPAGYSPTRPPPLVVLLHGAGSDARGGLAPLRDPADEAGVMLLAPKSRGRTWDVVLGGFGPDVASMDALLGHVFERFAVDRSRLALGGFSDGASYALSLGLTNGELFTHLIAFSPGFMDTGEKRGRPSIYVSHGVEDRVLPIDSCSRVLVPQLRRAHYDVDYREFDGGHTVPAGVARAALRWLLARESDA